MRRSRLGVAVVRGRRFLFLSLGRRGIIGGREREREASKKNHTFAKRKRKTDRRRDPRDATLATPPETSERCVRVGTPRRLNARTRGNVCAFFRELYTRRFGFADENEFLFSSSLSHTKQQKKKLTSVILYKNELFNRDVRIALYPFPLRVDRYRRRDWLWRRHDVDGSLGGGKERHRRALRQGDVLGGVETSFGRARERLRGGGRTPIIPSLM